MAMPKLFVEPGRSIAGKAGVTAYTVGTVKVIPGVRTYVAVDGGMSDNLRPMLYDSRYEAMLANKAEAPATDVSPSPASTANPATCWCATCTSRRPSPGTSS